MVPGAGQRASRCRSKGLRVSFGRSMLCRVARMVRLAQADRRTLSPPGAPICRPNRRPGRSSPGRPPGAALSETDSKRVLACYGIATPKEILARDAEGAAMAVSQIAGPTAIKIVSPDILHKTEAGGVRLGVSTPEDARTAAEQILASCLRYAPKARIEGISVQQMVPAGIEIVLGVKNDLQFGPLVAAGLGGIMVELIADTAVRLAPVGEPDRARDAGFPERLCAAHGLSRQAGRGY